MKKIFLNSIYFFITFCFFCCMTDVNAYVNECSYEFGDTDSVTYEFEFDTEKGTYKNKSEKTSDNNIKYKSIYDFESNEIKSLGEGECLDLYLVEENKSSGSDDQNKEINLNFFSDSSRMKEKFGSDVKYVTGKTAPNVCSSLKILTDNIESLYTEYKECSGAKCSNQLGKAKEAVEKLRIECKNILANRDVIIEDLDGKNAPTMDDCVNKCLTVEEEIEDIKDSLGIDKITKGSCGFSTRLVSWGLNIMKWVKYIVPVFVIIFGLFDFIKAIGADKEDEMKKAQKKFIKRLIAAALIFIFPFIIEFTLDKFGFTAEGCGVINELD